MNRAQQLQQEFIKENNLKSRKEVKKEERDAKKDNGDFQITLAQPLPDDKVYMVEVYGWIDGEFKYLEDNFISSKKVNREFNLRRYERDYGKKTNKVKLKIK